MKCAFCGYENGRVWDGQRYSEVAGKHGEFYHVVTATRKVKHSEEHWPVVMCPVPTCQRTQLET